MCLLLFLSSRTTDDMSERGFRCTKHVHPGIAKSGPRDLRLSALTRWQLLKAVRELLAGSDERATPLRFSQARTRGAQQGSHKTRVRIPGRHKP